MIRINTIVTGGQSGADIGAWQAAKTAGIRTAGYMPLHFMTEDGPKPEYGSIYSADELESSSYRVRTEANVIRSDSILLFGDSTTPGSKLLKRLAREYKRPLHLMGQNFPQDRELEEAAAALKLELMGTLRRVMVGGNRESYSPGIARDTRENMLRLFFILKDMQ